MISMLIDHTNKGILWLYLEDNSSIWLQLLSDIFEILGRVAFPIFLFQLVEGFIHTKNFLKYVTRLFVFALISEVPYDMFESGEFWVPQSQNMFFTLTLALIVLWLIDKVKSRNSKLWVVWALLIGFFASFLSACFAFDYTYYGILIPVIMYILKDSRLLASIFGYLVVIKELWSFTGFVAINMYNGERGKINKWIGYWFYPAHLVVIGLIRIFVIES